jgi:hypothetical protein
MTNNKNKRLLRPLNKTIQIKQSTKFQEVVNEIRQCSETTSIHAIPNIVRSKYWIVKIGLSICFLVSTLVCIWLMNKAIQDYFNYDVITIFRNFYLSSISFPVIMICNSNGTNRHIGNLVKWCRFNTDQDCKIDFSYVSDAKYKDCYRYN